MKMRLREFGFQVGTLPTGMKNHLSDVPGVSVGHISLHSKTGQTADACTGVTAILPHQDSLFHHKVPAAAHIINGYGKTTGLVQVDELGEIESPILLTNTFGVPAAVEGTLKYMMETHAEIGDTTSVNVVVGECNDSYLNDMRSLHVRPRHALAALENARNHPSLAEGAVGAGMGMRCFGWKGGIGSSSRIVTNGAHFGHVGVLVLTNFGRPEELVLLGRPVGAVLSAQKPVSKVPDLPVEGPSNSHGLESGSSGLVPGSIMIIVATDLPLQSLELKRMAKRAAFGIARTGGIAHHGSGDVVIAFSNYNDGLQAGKPNWSDRISPEMMNVLFQAVVEATEESILNSLFAAETTVGRLGRVVEELPVHEVVQLLRRSDEAE